MMPATEEGALEGNAKPGRGYIDTAAPFESVKAAVSMFGGIVDWKAHKAQTVERHKQVQVDLDKTQEEIEHYRSQSEAAEEEKARAVKELESTRRLVEELKLSLEKAETEETQAKQDSELALLRVREMQQGIVGEASVADQAELDVAKSRHASAVAELESVKKELEASREEYSALLKERDVAVKSAEEAASKSRDVEKKVEDLSLDLITAKEALESAHVAHMEAEEHRMNVALAQGKDAALDWEKEFRQVEEEMRQLNERIAATKDLQDKVDTASATLLGLKSEFSAYVEAKPNGSEDAEGGDAAARALPGTEKEELDEVKRSIEKAKEEVKCLRVAVASLKAELAGEEAAVASMKEKEGARPAQVSSLESQLSRIEMEIELLQAKEKESLRQLEELPQSLQQATLVADEAKSAANLANEELRKAREEAQQAKAAFNAAESRLKAASREIDAAKASERLAFDAIKALEESEKAAATSSDVDSSQSGVTLPLEEYYALSKKAHDAEEEANNKVADATSLVEEAKKSEARSLERLGEATRRLEERKESLRVAVEKADNANEGKLAVEQELREWRAVSEQRRKAGDDDTTTKDHVLDPSEGGTPRKRSDGRRDTKSMDIEQESPTAIRRAHSAKMDASATKDGRVAEPKKKKKSFFPRIVMFLARKKAHSAK